MTDADGNIAQHIEYIPYGEVFVEERNSQFSTNFLFNAKELDNETGLYYYGARYLDPTGGMWLSVDPLFEKYAGMSPYNYCMGNPVAFFDPDGLERSWFLTITGGLRMFGGAIEMVGSGVAEVGSGGVVTPAAALVFLNGVDNFQAGFRQMWTGEETNTLFYNGVHDVAVMSGASNETADNIATVADLSTAFIGGGQGINKGLNALNKGSQGASIASKFGQFKEASKYGFDTYNALKNKVATNSGLEVHHLIEKRFAKILGVKQGDMLSIVLTHDEHKIFTESWKKFIGYRGTKASLRTDNVTKDQIFDVARQIYKEYPEILKALNLE